MLERAQFALRRCTEDKTTRVIWSDFVRRLRCAHICSTPGLREPRGFADCSQETVAELAEHGFWRTTPSISRPSPFPMPAGRRKPPCSGFSPSSLAPEPGWLEWPRFRNLHGSTRTSRAYVEDWRLLPESRAFRCAFDLQADAASATCLYVAGEHAIYARNRAVDLPSDGSSSPGMLNANAVA